MATPTYRPGTRYQFFSESLILSLLFAFVSYFLYFSHNFLRIGRPERPEHRSARGPVTGTSQQARFVAAKEVAAKGRGSGAAFSPAGGGPGDGPQRGGGKANGRGAAVPSSQAAGVRASGRDAARWRVNGRGAAALASRAVGLRASGRGAAGREANGRGAAALASPLSLRER